jgi:hypothetical protein
MQSLFINQRYDEVKAVLISGFDISLLNYVKESLSKFDVVSVREVKLHKQLEEFGISARVDVDPTLLLSVEDYACLEINTKIDYPYILVYAFHISDELDKAIKKLSQEKGLKVVVINPTIYSFIKDEQLDYQELFHVVPGEFLSLIKNASYVLVSSFHGVVFSILYKKQFKYFSGLNSPRINGMLDSLDLKSCSYNNCKDFKDDIDYSCVNIKILDMANESKKYLLEIVNS